MALLLGAHGTGPVPGCIPQPGILLHPSPGIEDGDMTSDLKLDGPADVSERIHVLQLGPNTQVF